MEGDVSTPSQTGNITMPLQLLSSALPVEVVLKRAFSSDVGCPAVERPAKEECCCEIDWNWLHAKFLEQLNDGFFFGVHDHSLLIDIQSVEGQPVGSVKVS